MSSLAVLVVPLFLLQGATAGIIKVSDVSPVTKVPVSPVTKVPVSPVTKVPVSPVTKVPVSPVTVTVAPPVSTVTVGPPVRTVTVGPPVSTVTVGPPVRTVTVGPPVTEVVPVMVPLTPEELKGLSYFLMDQVNDGIKNLAKNASQIELADIDDTYDNGTDTYEWSAMGGKLLTSGIDLIPDVKYLTMEVSGTEETNNAVHFVQFKFSISLKNPVIEYDYFDFDFSGGNDPEGSQRAAHGVERTNSTPNSTSLGAISVEVVKNSFDIQLLIVHAYGPAGSPICVAAINTDVTDFVVNPIKVQKDSLMKPVIEKLANLIETQLVEDTQVIQTIEQIIEQTYTAFIPFCDYVQPDELKKALEVFGI